MITIPLLTYRDREPRLKLARALAWGIDPEWLFLQIFLLVTPLICILRGDLVRAAFFTKLALLVGALKWLGWVMFTKVARPVPSYLMFPAELVLGLALLVVWFYLRNVVGWLVPGSYSLMELGILPWLVLAVHLGGTILSPSASSVLLAHSWRKKLPETSVYGAFTLGVTLTLWSVAQDVFPPSLDGWFHSFIARVYHNDGLFFRHFGGDQAIFYASGFGAINAVTAAVSGLSVVKVHNLQHIFWTVVGFSLMTASMSIFAKRTLPAVHYLPFLFLSVYPVHNFPPDVHWTHGPQQLAPSLLVAIPLLSLLMPMYNRRTLYCAVAIQAVLSVLVLALNPVCAVFLLVACTASLIVNCYRGRPLGERVLKVASIQAGATLLAALIILGSDRYYSTLILNPSGAGYLTGPQFGVDSATDHPRFFSFSVESGLKALVGINPMHLVRWPEEFKTLPGRHLPWLVLVLALVACSLTVIQGRRSAGHVAACFAAAAAAAFLGWLVTKCGAIFFAGGIDNPAAFSDAQLLREYLYYLTPRIELWSLFLAGLAAAVSIYLCPGNRTHRTVGSATLIVALATLTTWWIPFAHTQLDPRKSLLTPKNVGVNGRITREDIALASWMEQNLPTEKGLIGLASLPVKLGPTELLFPMSASQTLPLYGKHYNFTFQVFDPTRQNSFSDYVLHVKNFLDVEWCLKNNIRFFHLPTGDFWPNHGLMRAVQIGLLKPIRTASSSAVYAVQALPWTPQTVSIGVSPTRSHQVNLWPDGEGIRGIAEGTDPQLVFKLSEPLFVHAIRFKYTLTNQTNSPSHSQLFWSHAGQDFVEHERTARLWVDPTSKEETLTILVHDTIDQFRFDPDDKPAQFSIGKVELLIRPRAHVGQNGEPE
ncbi:hypothetical protein ABIB94_008846 [Bradyrhizobium sp. JR7.2]|uniref:hypothetical protein n=1 Tax=Bradyrhizobium sp. JR7.2 TaxID=3156375 RepID=UPI0033958C34